MGELRRRLERVSWALTDQVLFAGSNFVLGLLMARWMSPEVFGGFATALVVQTLTIATYEAAFTEPLTVFGAGRHRERFQSYLGTLIVGHFVVTIAVATGIALVAFLLMSRGQLILSGALFGLSAAVPLVCLRYLARRACYARDLPRLATVGGVVYAVALFAAVGFLASDREITFVEVFGALAVASLLSSIASFAPLGTKRPDAELLREVPAEHWKYSRWLIGSVVIRQIPENIWYFILPIWAGLEGNAALRALANLNLFVGHMTAACAMLLLPAMVRAKAESPQRFRKLSLEARLGFGFLTLSYWAIVALFGGPLVGLMYDGKYVEYAPLLAIYGLAPVLNSLTVVSSSRAHAAERPDLHFRSATLSMIGIPPGVLLAYLYGLPGVIVGSLLVSGIMALTLLRSTSGPISSWR